jgi:N-acetylneuraminic acid mutarotase
MAYQVIDLANHSKPQPANYFFDTNVLLYVMGVSNKQAYETQYINFFNSVYRVAITTKTSRILTSSLQISELFNRLLKLESSKAYVKGGYTKGEYAYYKDVFRKGNDIKKLYQQFQSDFLAYKDGFDVVTCPLKTIDDILNFSPDATDINDHLYMELVKQQGAIMVTHDADLLCHDMPILTMNKKLIATSRNFTVNP